ncbi:DUF2149 domain-containing protein [Pseudocolwellia sp. AS88]|jgi:hypothetical protein|uniref:DUF2149 domain-containing protein n=1 Tax=Pseudocolwellia sp. AS88 TaxID=3063958 RepID=UPI0026EBBB89|nr:DUF2149 domain-containing protein [Pseudocolwellia sp. AS88]MDO7083706.1 DUF2149 domain-containing protein [Pseudocolwellia sp. AS88]
MSNKSSWQSSQFAEQDTDPLAGFANIMDVMLVFALGLMLALVAQSKELQERFSIESNKTEVTEVLEVTTGTELIEAPESLANPANAKANGMESLGQVYKDPKTGKLILISGG